VAVPKRRMSRSNTRSRRAQWKASAPTLVRCPQCRDPKLPHTACPTCGTYNRPGHHALLNTRRGSTRAVLTRQAAPRGGAATQAPQGPGEEDTP
jgi:large subunit ribosomal protein L32